MLVVLPLLFLLLIIAIVDLLTRHIPNYLISAGLIYSFVIALFSIGPINVLNAILGLLLGVLIFIFPYGKGLIGAGDVKLIGLVGSFMGPALVLDSILYAAIIGGIFTVFYLLDKKALKNSLTGLLKLDFSGARIPYAYAISLGTFLTFLNPTFL